MENFLCGFMVSTMIWMFGFALDKIDTSSDNYIISQCVEMKKYLEAELADNSKKDDLQRKLEQLENWESEK